jgi:hypothetical protein
MKHPPKQKRPRPTQGFRVNAAAADDGDDKKNDKHSLHFLNSTYNS